MYNISKKWTYLRERDARWLLLTFSLPTKRASQRVEIWRKLQRYGAVPLGNSGYLLPNNPVTRERFEWLAISIRKYGGDASVVKVVSIDNLTSPQLIARFAEARSRDYQELIGDLENLASIPRQKRPSRRLSRIRARFREITEVDFFRSPLQKRVEKLLAQADLLPAPEAGQVKINPRDYSGRVLGDTAASWNRSIGVGLAYQALCRQESTIYLCAGRRSSTRRGSLRHVSRRLRSSR